MRRFALLLLLSSAIGCAQWQLPSRRPPASASPVVVRLAEADGLAASKPQEARRLYREVLRQKPPDEMAAEALYGLARLRLDPASPLKDYRVAAVTLAQLRARYPRSRRALDARAWQAVLGEIDRCELERGRLKTDLDRMKEADFELEGEP
jgi:hypothetical protein